MNRRVEINLRDLWVFRGLNVDAWNFPPPQLKINEIKTACWLIKF